MAKLNQTINVDEIEEQESDFAPIPAGWYDAQIIQSEIKDTKAGTGKYISLQIEILGPDYAGRMVWDNLNIVNPNPQAVSIAKSQLKKLCKAIGVVELGDTEELHGKIFLCKLGIRPAQGDYSESNQIKAYKASENSATSPIPNTKEDSTSTKPDWA